MANTRRRSQRGGSVNVQTATNAGTPVPNILRSNGRAPNKPSKGAVMGGRRSRRHRGGRPPPPQFMPGATAAASASAPPTSEQLMDYVNKCKEADQAVKDARAVIAADPPSTFIPQKSQQAQLQTQRDAHAKALAQALAVADSKCTANAKGLTTSTIDAAAAGFAPTFVPAVGGRMPYEPPAAPVYAEGGRMPYEPPAAPVYEEGGGRRRGGKTRKASPWNLFVKKIFGEMKRKHGKGASFSDALKEASRRKKEM